MKMFEKLKHMLTTKSSATSSIVALHTAGRPQWTPKNYAALAREGFAGNVIGYRAVRMVAEAAASIVAVCGRQGNHGSSAAETVAAPKCRANRT